MPCARNLIFVLILGNKKFLPGFMAGHVSAFILFLELCTAAQQQSLSFIGLQFPRARAWSASHDPQCWVHESITASCIAGARCPPSMSVIAIFSISSKDFSCSFQFRDCIEGQAVMNNPGMLLRKSKILFKFCSTKEGIKVRLKKQEGEGLSFQKLFRLACKSLHVLSLQNWKLHVICLSPYP